MQLHIFHQDRAAAIDYFSNPVLCRLFWKYGAQTASTQTVLVPLNVLKIQTKM